MLFLNGSKNVLNIFFYKYFEFKLCRKTYKSPNFAVIKETVERKPKNATFLAHQLDPKYDKIANLPF